MSEMTKGIIAVVMAFIFSGLLVFSGFMLHLNLAKGNHLWWIGLIRPILYTLVIVFIVAWYSIIARNSLSWSCYLLTCL